MQPKYGNIVDKQCLWKTGPEQWETQKWCRFAFFDESRAQFDTQ